MKPLLIIQILFLLSTNPAHGQGSDWEKNVPGKLYPAPGCKIPRFKINDVFRIINEIPMIAKPKGFDVKEWFETSTIGNVYTAKLYLNFYEYYSFDGGPVQLSNSHPTTISIYINDPGQLMNPQSILFPQETKELNLPVMFTDTFTLRPIFIKDSEVLYGISTEFNSRVPLYVLKPKSAVFFKPVTKEQYIRFWIGKLSIDIDKANKQIEENKLNLVKMEKNTSVYTSLPEVKKAHEAFVKWTNFLKEQKQHYQRKLGQMTLDDKKAAAHYTMPTEDIAVMMNREGEYLEKISGHIPYEPAETNGIPVFTYIKDAFDSGLPKSAIQLMIIEDPYGEGETDELKELLDKQFFPILSFKEIFGLMYK